MSGVGARAALVADTPQTVDEVVEAARAASRVWRTTPADARAEALDRVADALDAAADALIDTAIAETSLARPRLVGELRRTTFQLRFFGGILRDGTGVEATVDRADPDWPMGAPRPDLRRTAVAVGPVLVFAASNFPFAFSVAGGDTASALAAGCPVIVKAHSGHPELSVATARVVADALRDANAPDGLFALVLGTENGVRALRHPAIAAAGFTGSIPAGRRLFDIAAAREAPIPFYGELGSVNPVVVTARAAEARPDEIAEGFLASLLGSSGQLCTKPGIVLVPAGSALDARLREAAVEAPHPLLNERIDRGYRDALAEARAHPRIEVLAEHPATGAALLAVDAADFEADRPILAQELFGPAGLVVRYEHDTDAARLLEGFDGQLTATIVAEDDEADDERVRDLVELAVERAGRVLWNQWPTGVSVTGAQQHGGPYPASTDARSTSVGAAAMGRFLRPVAFQGMPAALLPPHLRG